MQTRLMPAALVVAALALLLALGVSGLSAYRVWRVGQGQVLSDPYYFGEAVKRIGVMVTVAAIHVAAIAACLRVLRNRFARAAAYCFVAGIIAASVFELASVWPIGMLDEMPKRYVDYKAIDFEGPRRVGFVATLLAVGLLSAGWVLLVVAVFRRKTAPTARAT